MVKIMTQKIMILGPCASHGQEYLETLQVILLLFLIEIGIGHTLSLYPTSK